MNIFIHGLGQDASSWTTTRRHLSTKDHSESVHLPDLVHNQEVIYHELYHQFTRYCQHYDQPLHLTGLSLGGILALNFAIENPEKVATLCLIATQDKMPKTLLNLQSHVFKWLPNRSFSQMGFTKNQFISLTRSMGHLNFRDDLNKVACPTIIICGSQDIVNKKASYRLKKGIPKASMVLIDRAGHEVNQHQPLSLASILHNFYQSNA
ncbi:alpha/beta hydrolase [Shouchella sp. 1P09AA]|uniref:alpha/beta fold hydrolase n=1 Tax=unclassified Shouchella TaxID=2893065 RepID=UPI0039A27B38